MWDHDNPLVYRRAAAAGRRPRWKGLLGWAAYPLLVSSPFWLFGAPAYPGAAETPWLLALFLHFLYFAGRPLFETISTFSAERQRRTLDCLLTTGFPVRRWCRTLFVCAVQPRLLEAVLFVWIFELFPGREPPVVFQMLPLTVGCVLFYAAAGMGLSVRSRNQALAQLKAILLLTTSMLFIVGVDALITDSVLGLGHPLFSALTCPWITVVYRWNDELQPWLVALASLLHGGLAWVALRLTEKHLCATPAGPSPRPPARSKILRWVENPLLYRSLVQRGRWHRLLMYPGVLLSLRFGLPALTDTDGVRGDVLGYPPSGVETALYLALLVHMLYFTVRALTACSHAVAEERENRTWEPLLSTRLSLNGLMHGQCAVRLLPVLGECLLWSPLWLMFSECLGGPLSQPNTVILVVYSLSWIAFIGSFALWQSSRSSSAGQALRNTAAFALGLAFVTIAVDGLTERLDDFCSSWFSPAWALMQLTEYASGPEACLVGLAGYLGLVPVLLLLYRRCLKVGPSAKS
ncbi:MAG: hypothetical protein HY319_20680 [Armatimonadetes bacterium]|nr:hypothetical protein [Armatimonadota bacterium]